MNTIKISKTTLLAVVLLMLYAITLSGCGSTDAQSDIETITVEMNTPTGEGEQDINIECTVLDVREMFIPTDYTMYYISIILEDNTGCRMAVNYNTRYLNRTYKTQVDEKSEDTYSKLKLIVPGDKVIYHGNYDFELINNNENTVAE